MAGERTLSLLLIEDNEADARFIEELLHDAAELTVRASGRPGTAHGASETPDLGAPTLHHETRLEAGLDRLAAEPVDVVLLDLNLPDSSGLETLSAVLDRTDIPVVVLTGLRDREMGVRALREGAEEYLVKDEINSDLLIRTVYHAIERREHERELQRYEVLMEQSTDVNAVVADDGTVEFVTSSVERVLGYPPEQVQGADAFSYIHPDDRETAREAFEAVLAGESRPPIEFRFRHADGSWVVLEARSRNLHDEPLVDGVVIYTRDVTDRVERERTLEQQREQLAALNDLNAVVREIAEALVEQSTRAEIERVVVDRLAAADSYAFAWIGEVDRRNGEVTPTARAGVDGYLDGTTISTDEDDPTGRGPTGTAARTGEVQVVSDVRTDPEYEPWRDRAAEYGFRSTAAIPLRYRDTLYGILNVYADRADAFEGEEGTVVRQLGQLVAHAINAIERKQVLLSDEVIELEFAVAGYFDALGVDASDDGTITFARVVPVGDDRYVGYGTASEDALATLSALAEQLPSWEAVSVADESGAPYRFEVQFAGEPVVSRIGELGGRVHRAAIEDGAFHLTVHLPPSTDVRRVTDEVRDELPGADLLAQRRTAAETDSVDSLAAVFQDRLTTRQQHVLEAAYFAGFFEWPRDSTGEDIAEMLDVSPPTFHQHVRAGERELLAAVFDPGEPEE